MEYLLTIPIVFSVIAWFVAAGSWFLSLGHLVEGVTKMSMAFNGVQAFDSDNFTDEGKVHQSRFLKSLGLFVLFVFVSIVGVVLFSPK